MIEHQDVGVSYRFAAYLAIDALNSYVRSESYKNHGYGVELSTWIYYLKTRALSAAYAEGLLKVEKTRLVQSHVQCRVCSGTGQFRPATEHRGAIGCRTCSGKGHLFLQFVETRFPCQWEREIVWHTPRHQWWRVRGGPGFTSADAVPAGDWHPRIVGKDLLPGDVARHLVTAEEYFPRDRAVYYEGRDDWGNELWDVSQYAIYLGATENVCGICGLPAPQIPTYGCQEGWLRWTDHVCGQCVRHFDLLAKSGGVGNLRAHLHPPRALLRNSDIQAWIEFQAIRRPQRSRSPLTAAQAVTVE